MNQDYREIIRACSEAGGVVVGSVASGAEAARDIDIIVPRSSIRAIAAALDTSCEVITYLRIIEREGEGHFKAKAVAGPPTTEKEQFQAHRSVVMCEGLPPLDIWYRDDSSHEAHVRWSEQRRVFGMPMHLLRPNQKAYYDITIRTINELDRWEVAGKITDRKVQQRAKRIARKRKKKLLTIRSIGCWWCCAPKETGDKVTCKGKAKVHRWLHLDWLGYPWPLRLRPYQDGLHAGLCPEPMPGCGCIAPLKRFTQRFDQYIGALYEKWQLQ